MLISNSALASGIGHDVKPIARPHAAIIDEVDEILMDDARKPLIIAQSVDMGARLDTAEHNGRAYKVSDILIKVKKLEGARLSR